LEKAIFKSPPLPTLSSTKSVEERKKPKPKPKPEPELLMWLWLFPLLPPTLT